MPLKVCFRQLSKLLLAHLRKQCFCKLLFRIPINEIYRISLLKVLVVKEAPSRILFTFQDELGKMIPELDILIFMLEPSIGIEPMTYALQVRCSTN